jgi:hypothetical protein
MTVCGGTRPERSQTAGTINKWAHHKMYIICDSPTLNERFRNPFSHRSLESTQVLAKI